MKSELEYIQSINANSINHTNSLTTHQNEDTNQKKKRVSSNGSSTNALPRLWFKRTYPKHCRNIKHIKVAFSELHLMLVLLNNYQALNAIGFRKILKIHDNWLQTSSGEEWR